METTLSQGGRCYVGEGGDPRRAQDADPGQGKEGRAQVQREEGRGGERHQPKLEEERGGREGVG